MKVIWEFDDIVPGQIVGIDDMAERWMIGYIVDWTDGTQLALVSTTDGLVSCITPRSQFAEVLGEGGYLPVVLLDRVKRQ